MVVSTNPDGSFLPGMMNFAMTPAMNPMMIVQMMPMTPFHDLLARYSQAGANG
jgi:hypothetical protein